MAAQQRPEPVRVARNVCVALHVHRNRPVGNQCIAMVSECDWVRSEPSEHQTVNAACIKLTRFSKTRLTMFSSRSQFRLNSAPADERHDFDLIPRLQHASGMSRSRHELLIPLNRQVPRQQLEFLKQFGH